MTENNRTRRPRPWRWIHHDGKRLYDVGLNADGSLHNPNGYPEDIVRAVVTAADEDLRQRRSAAATKAAETRRRRQELRVYQVARRIGDGEAYGPAQACVICGRGLDDPQSIRRGIGSDCWQDVLSVIETGRMRETQQGEHESPTRSGLVG